MPLHQISQSHLALLEYCPRKFQYAYLDNLTSPQPLEEQARLRRGSQIHHLMQQQELQLPLPKMESTAKPWPQEMASIYQMATALATAIPPVGEPTRFRQSEYRLHLNFEGVLLTVIYDLLVLTDTNACIFDWKTYSTPPNQNDLALEWQTRLYPFVLAEASEYAATDISLTYWFIQPPSHKSVEDISEIKPDCIQFDYGDRLHHQTRDSLTQILAKLQQWLLAYDTGTPLPQTDDIQGRCSRCQFALRCARSRPAAEDTWFDLEDIEAIEEIPVTSLSQQPDT